MEFGIISEGATDQVVLETILQSFFNDKDLLVNQLQPKPGDAGNWDKVFNYIGSQDFRDALTSEYRVDYVIIQIDTDFMRMQEVPAQYRFDMNGLNEEQIAGAMREKLIEVIGLDFYEEFERHIIFAIAVDAIECWFLPIYFQNNPQKAGKTTNCLGTLNPELSRAEGFTIVAKEIGYYRTICRNWRKRNDLLAYAQKNFSLGLFIEELSAKCQP